MICQTCARAEKMAVAKAYAEAQSLPELVVAPELTPREAEDAIFIRYEVALAFEWRWDDLTRQGFDTAHAREATLVAIRQHPEAAYWIAARDGDLLGPINQDYERAALALYPDETPLH